MFALARVSKLYFRACDEVFSSFSCCLLTSAHRHQWSGGEDYDLTTIATAGGRKESSRDVIVIDTLTIGGEKQ